ncbi:MAG: ASKHA domain-containing protein [Desulfobulbaceae bacterium]|nr:ASKHA domain-containing protein [Desulfobulbaceae bacterium]
MIVSSTPCQVTFLPSGRKIRVDSGTSIIRAARQGGLHINASCGGTGVCGKCRVMILEGEVDGGISDKLAPEDIRKGYRQACTSIITGDIVVQIPEAGGLTTGQLGTEVPERHRAAMHIINIEALQEEGIFIPPVEKFFLELPRPDLNDRQADAGRLLRAMKEQYDERHIHISHFLLKRMRRVLREDDFRVTVTLARPVNRRFMSRMLNLQSGNWTARNYGIAVDIGTTTVYGQLIDKQTGRILGESGDYNRQLGHGEDVISRMIAAEKPEGLRKMHELVTGSINNIIDSLLAQQRIERDEITSVTLAGNTAMTHLFLELEPHNIRRSPYVPVSTLIPPIRCTDLRLHLGGHCMALLYPAVSSYVGGDIVAGVMGSGMYRTEKLTLFIDIGTNAEIVIGNREWLACAACSAGPAFEGGGILHGMRAGAGAIEDFSLDPVTLEPMNITIGAGPAVGICGSGLLIIVSTLYECGVIDQRGRFNREMKSERIRLGRNGFEFVLVRAEESGIEGDIVLTEVDIDNFIRAKGAIHAGMTTLLGEVGLEVTDIDQVILAGAFGSYLDLDSAMTTGLFPEISPDKFIYVGNGSLLGCRMSELSNHIRRDVVRTMQRMTGFELSEVASYKDRYVASLFLPHTNARLFPRTAERRRAMELLKKKANLQV